MRILKAALLLVSFAASSAYAQRPQIQWNEAYDWESVETFAWQSTPESSLEEANPFMHSRIIAAIEYELTSGGETGGLTEVTSDPDLYVTYHASSEERVRVTTDTWGYGVGGYGRGAWGYYGYGYGGPVSSTTTVHEYEEGTLVVDIWDASGMELIWRGTVSRVFSENPQRAERQVVKAIERMANRGRQLWEKANR